MAASVAAMSDSNAPETCKQFLEKVRGKVGGWGRGGNEMMQARGHTALTAGPTFLTEKLSTEKSLYLKLATFMK